jgi:hypothetical protein
MFSEIHFGFTMLSGQGVWMRGLMEIEWNGGMIVHWRMEVIGALT